MDAGQFVAARCAIEEAVERLPNVAIAHESLGCLCFEQGDYSGAVASFEQAAQLGKLDAIILTFLGVAYRRQRDTVNAEASFRQAIDIDPKWDEAHFNLAALLVDAGRFAEAERHYGIAIEVDPDFALAHRELGHLILKQRRDQHARIEFHLSRAIELDPDDWWARIWLGSHFYGTNSLDEALTQFRLAAQVAPKEPVPLWTMADVYAAWKDWPRARALNERALALDPSCVPAMTNLASILIQNGSSDAAMEILDQALSVDPGSTIARRLRDNSK